MIPSGHTISDGADRPTGNSSRRGGLRSDVKVPRRLRPGPLSHAAGYLSFHTIAAWFAFPLRFDRTTATLARARSGGAVSPGQAQAHFGHRLFIEVDPGTLTHRLDEKHLDHEGRWHWIGDHFLDADDWNGRLSPLAHSPAHREIVEICGTRHNFREGRHYRSYVQSLQQKRPVRRNGRRLDTIEKIDAYFRYYVDLIDNIERAGVLPRNRFQHSADTGRRHRGFRSLWHDLVERDIGIAIGADGRLVRHTSGKHRLAAAVGLGLKRIPVEIRLVHLDWLEQQMGLFDLPPASALQKALEEQRFGQQP